MFGISDYGAFCAAILLFLALPGPGTFALLTSTGKGGLRAGAAATLGVILGDQVLMWLAVGGVLYTTGIIFYVLDTRLRHAHGVWHLFVLGGSAAHYFAILFYVL